MVETKKDSKKIFSVFDVTVAEFIRDHKKLGQAVDDDITVELITEFGLDADGIEALLTKIQDAGKTALPAQVSPVYF